MRALLAAVAGAAGVAPAAGIDNGLGVTPPRGWRSWNLFHADINDGVMRAQMRAVLDRSRSVGGKPTSLADLGFSWISMDDGWQKCNCSTGGSEDPALPKCPNCKSTGQCSWHQDGGRPVVDTRKFPNMKALVDYGHSLGLKVGSYLNNCICMEGGDPPMGRNCKSPTHYEEDVAFIIATGFDGVKIDNCGSSHNVTRWAELFNRTGKPIRIESCHTFHPNHGTPSGWPNFPVWDPPTKASEAECPMNFYRTGGDIGPNFGSILGEAYATVQYNDHHLPDGTPDPFSHPGCWAYPDMQEIGNFNGADPLRTDEERTHWGLWVVNSAPLILGLDMNVSDTMDRIWPTITNPDALAVSDAWAGHPGTLVKTYPARGAVPYMVDQGPCDGSAQTRGWRVDNSSEGEGWLVAPGGTPAAPLCLGAAQGPTGQNFGYNGCPPPTVGMPASGCGVLITNCSDAKGAWEHDARGALLWRQKPGAAPKCLSAGAARAVGGFYGGPVAAITNVGGCPGGQNVKNTSKFSLSGTGEMRVGDGSVCLVARPYFGAQLWSKPLPGGRAAALVVNLAGSTQAFALPLADVPGVACGGSGCDVRDVWAQKDLGVQRGRVEMELREHESSFYIIGPSK